MLLEHLPSRYAILRELGSGGMGRVLLARDNHLGKDLALKVLHERPGDDDDLEHLREEFALLSKIEHPGIARAYDFGFVDRLPYFTSEFIPGETLPAGASNGGHPQVTPEEFLERASLLVEALAFLHRGGIIHLDIKPSNIVVSTDGRPVLIDFGLFRRSVPLRARGRLRGSLPYMAPECFSGGPIGPWTDVYALGVTLYQAATGQFPRVGAAGEMGADAWLPAPRPLSHLGSSLPEAFDHIVLKCLALDPARRFRSAGDLAEVFRSFHDGAVPAAAPEVAAATTIGRASELAVIDAFLAGFEQAGSGPKPATLLVTGPPGMGQTHILREMKIRAQTRGIPFYLELGHPGLLPSPGALLRPFGAHLREEARARWDALLERLRRPRASAHGEVTHEERRLRWRGEIALAAAALREPLIIAVDGLQHFDEISVLLLIDLARVVGKSGCETASPLGLALGYREEGPLVHLLRELTETLLRPGAARLLPLRPLDPVACRELYRRAGGKAPGRAEGLSLFQETGGSPAHAVARALEQSTFADEGSSDSEREKTGAALPGSGTPERSLFVILGLIRRPAASDMLARLSGFPPRAVSRILDRLHERKLVVEDRSGAGIVAWTLTPGIQMLLDRCSRTERQRAHRNLARALVESAGEGDVTMLLEAAEHFLAAGNRGAFIRHGLLAAGYLRDTFQNRTALDLFERILGALPGSRVNQRLRIILAMAELRARVGEIERGIDLLRRELRAPKGIPDSLRVRLLLRLATLHSRDGDFRMADSLFRKGLEESRAGRARMKREELLLFLNEHAAMKVFTGDLDGALELCNDGLALARQARKTRAVQEVILNLQAARANVALRRFRFEEAARDFLRSLETAESIGSAINEAVILNNLGIVYSQSDRYAEAVVVFRKAERACLELDEGPSLTFIYGNLALLHAKTGDFSAMEEALGKAAALAAGEEAPSGPTTTATRPGRRQRLFLEHHHGVALLYRGRYAEARPHLEEATRLGRAVGDQLAVLFDQVYRAECLIFEGLYGEARDDLTGLIDESVPAVPRQMALARLALLTALTGNVAGVDAIVEQYQEACEKREQLIPFLDAWDGLFIGWSLAITSAHQRAGEILAASEDYFREHGLRPGISLAGWLRAEAGFLDGRPADALDFLDQEPGPGSDLTAVLWPLLEARCLLEVASADEPRCADCLAEAGAALVGNPLPEWSARLEVLRSALLDSDELATRATRRREDLASRLPERRRYVDSAYWKVWRSGGSLGRRSARQRRHGARGAEASTATPVTRTAALERDDALIRRGLVVRSPATRRLARELDRLQETNLAVLVHGETGSGKEMVARAIHLESPRAKAPFLVFDCATVPDPLLELELFGARRGAFTGIEEDRPGLLERADGGTLLFDEIGATSLEVQGKLLRLLDGGEFRPLGSDDVTRVDVRFIFSTSRDLETEARGGAFREDLLYRVRVLAIRVPPLRQRREDISTLARLFLEEAGNSVPDNLRPPEFEPGFLERLEAREWPGNARELRNLMQRLRLEHTRTIPASAADAPASYSSPPDTQAGGEFSADLTAEADLPALKERLEREYILFHLRKLHGDTKGVSRLLGISRKQFYRRCRALGIRLREVKRRRTSTGE